MKSVLKTINKHLPLITDFKSTTFLKAFILNALVIAIIAALSIETRQYVGHKGVFGIGAKEELSEHNKFLITLVFTFFIALVVYHVMYVLFKFGGGMLISN